MRIREGAVRIANKLFFRGHALVHVFSDREVSTEYHVDDGAEGHQPQRHKRNLAICRCWTWWSRTAGPLR